MKGFTKGGREEKSGLRGRLERKANKEVFLQRLLSTMPGAQHWTSSDKGKKSIVFMDELEETLDEGHFSSEGGEQEIFRR